MRSKTKQPTFINYPSNNSPSNAEYLKRCMLFRGTERNQRGIFRKMLKRGTIVSKTRTSHSGGLWRG